MKIQQKVKEVLQGAEGNYCDTADRIVEIFKESLPTEQEIYEQLAGSEQYCQGQIDLWRRITDRWQGCDCVIDWDVTDRVICKKCGEELKSEKLLK